MKSSTTTLDSDSSVRELGRLLNNGFAEMKATVKPIQSSDNPLDSFDGEPEIAVFGEGRILLGGSWVVQAFVVDQGPKRIIELVAVGDSGLGRAFGGVKNTVSLGKSTDRMAALAEILIGAGARYAD